MAFMVTFVHINEETGGSFGRSWAIENSELETHLLHLAKQHFGEPFLESTVEEAFEETKALVESGQGYQEILKERLDKDKEWRA